MLRLSAIFPIVLSIVAFILSLLVLISGYKESFLPNVFVLKVRGPSPPGPTQSH